MSFRTHVTLAGLLIFAIAMPITVSAQGRGQGRGQGQGQGQTGGGTDVQVSATVIFRDSDRVAFRDYFTTHRVVAQPLPPGIAKKVARGKPLPPGIAKKALPADLVRIAPRGHDVSYAIVGNVVVATRGGVVVDVLTGVFK